jgi:hypothetical protein
MSHGASLYFAGPHAGGLPAQTGWRKGVNASGWVGFEGTRRGEAMSARGRCAAVHVRAPRIPRAAPRPGRKMQAASWQMQERLQQQVGAGRV